MSLTSTTVPTPSRPVSSPAADPASAPEPAEFGGIHVEDLGLRTRRGWVFRGASFDVPAGTLAYIAGPPHSGRTALLLSIAGRMRPTEGVVVVEGIDVTADPARGRRAVGVGLFDGLNDLDRDLSVGDHLRQELTLHPEVPGGLDLATLLDPVGLAIDPATPTEDLTPLERSLLGVALALVGSPAAIVVDDVDRDLGAAERSALWRTLQAIAAGGTTVLAACIDHEAALAAGRVLDLASSSSKED